MEILIGLLIGIPLTFLGSYWLFVLQKKQKKLGYEVLSADLVVPFESKPGDSIQVIVRKELLEKGHDSSVEQYVPAGEVYGFRVKLRNNGNETIGNQDVLIQLDNDAKVISIEIEDAPPAMESILTERVEGKSNTGKCNFPFLNEGDEIIVSILSVDNRSRECMVFASAPGLRTHDMGAQRRKRTLYIAFSAILGSIVFMIALIVGNVIYGTTSQPSEILADAPCGPIIFGILGLSFLVMIVTGILLTIRMRRDILLRIK